MSEYSGMLRMPGEADLGLEVRIDLTEERLRLVTGGSEIGDWSLDEVRINADEDGFHLRAEGEEVILEVGRDAEFAVELGLSTAPPLLRRRMAALLRGEA